MTTRILVTGSRKWSNPRPIREALSAAVSQADDPTDVIVVHGACPTGADFLAAHWCRVNGVPAEPHPANWSFGKSGGPVRNQEMVDAGANVCLAFPLPGSTGTPDCMERARLAGITVLVFEP